jgi:hypothetical protein
MVVGVNVVIAEIDPKLAIAENRVALDGVVNRIRCRVKHMDTIGTIERDDIGRARARSTNKVAGAADYDAFKRVAHRHCSRGISANDVALNGVAVCSV